MRDALRSCRCRPSMRRAGSRPDRVDSPTTRSGDSESGWMRASNARPARCLPSSAGTATGSSNSRPTRPFPPSTCCSSATWASPTRRLESEDRALPAAHPGRARRLAALHDGPFNISASVKAYFALKVIGDSPDAPHMRRGAGGDPGARRRRNDQRVHADAARAARHHSVAGRADDPGRDHVSCRDGFPSTCSGFPTGDARCWRRCWCCRR